MKRFISLSAIIFCSIFVINAQEKNTNINQENDSVHSFVPVKAQFPGGDKAMMKWLSDNITYPIEAQNKGIQGRVYVNFIVRSDGRIDGVKIAKGVHPTLDNEAMRLVKAMPKWNPGQNNGQNVSSYFTLPVTFILKDDSKTEKSTPVFSLPDTKAEFPGGKKALMNWIKKNINHSLETQKKGIKGKVLVKFIVEKNGSISNITIVESVHKILDDEAVRLIKLMPKWQPAKNKEEIVRSYHTLPFTFLKGGKIKIEKIKKQPTTNNR